MNRIPGVTRPDQTLSRIYEQAAAYGRRKAVLDVRKVETRLWMMMINHNVRYRYTRIASKVEKHTRWCEVAVLIADEVLKESK